jgi:hypothetical protein
MRIVQINECLRSGKRIRKEQQSSDSANAIGSGNNRQLTNSVTIRDLNNEENDDDTKSQRSWLADQLPLTVTGLTKTAFLYCYYIDCDSDCDCAPS